jgi:hypothetical protein
MAPQHEDSSPTRIPAAVPLRAIERVVRVIHDGRTFTFREDHDPPLVFWGVEVGGHTHPLPLRVMGDEGPEFSRALLMHLLERKQIVG